MIPKGKHHDRCHEHDGEDQETEALPFSEELTGQLLAQVQNRDTEAIPGESGLTGRRRSHRN